MDDLKKGIMEFATMCEAEFNLSAKFWEVKKLKKGDFFTRKSTVCNNLGYILSGVFRAYYSDVETGTEKNLFFFSEGQFVVAYKSFISQTPSILNVQALTETLSYHIAFDNLHYLYSTSTSWERFGRLMAEQGMIMGSDNIELLQFESPEARYVRLMKKHPRIFSTVPLYHIASYLGVSGPSLRRIREKMIGKYTTVI